MARPLLSPAGRFTRRAWPAPQPLEPADQIGDLMPAGLGRHPRHWLGQTAMLDQPAQQILPGQLRLIPQRVP